MRARGFTLIEVMLTLAGLSLFAVTIWALAFQGAASRDTLAVVAAVRDLEALVVTQQQGAYDFSALSDPGAVAALGPVNALRQNGQQATQWGVWSIAPIPRTDPNGAVTPAGGFRVTLQDLPSDVCTRVASGLKEGATAVVVDGHAVVGVAAVSFACGPEGGHAVAVEVMDGSKMGPVQPSA